VAAHLIHDHTRSTASADRYSHVFPSTSPSTSYGAFGKTSISAELVRFSPTWQLQTEEPEEVVTEALRDLALLPD
jgi:hypothetical protein